jgi:hypothetical protein
MGKRQARVMYTPTRSIQDLKPDSAGTAMANNALLEKLLAGNTVLGHV